MRRTSFRLIVETSFSPALAFMFLFRIRSYSSRYSGPWWIYAAGFAIAAVIAIASYFLRRSRGGSYKSGTPTDFMGTMNAQSGTQPTGPAPPGAMAGMATGVGVGLAGAGALPNATGGVVTTLLPAEAASLLSNDQSWVGAVAMFEMLHQGFLSMKSTAPLQLQRPENLPAQLPPYYTAFLDSLSADGSLDPIGLKKALAVLGAESGAKVSDPAKQMTCDYYHQGALSAWAQLRQLQDPVAKMQAYNDSFSMLLLDPSFVQSTMQAFAAGEYPVPPWALSLARNMGKQPSVAAAGLSLPGLDFAESVAGGFMALKNAVFVASSGA
jgi:hypothetical protein